jgi:hypothetical protein
MWTGELFESDQVEQLMAEAGIGIDPITLRDEWNSKVNQVLEIATLTRPEDGWMQTGGRKGVHTEHLGLFWQKCSFYLGLIPMQSGKKTLKYFALLALATTTLLACEKINELADVTFETTFEEMFSVNVPVATEPDGSAVFSESATIDLNDGDVKDYVDQLKNIVVKTVRLELISYSGPAGAEVSGEIDLGGGYALAIPPTNMQEALDNGTVIDMSDQAGAFNYLKDELLNQKMISYSLNGVVSEVPAQAEFKLTYTIDVTANPL